MWLSDTLIYGMKLGTKNTVECTKHLNSHTTIWNHDLERSIRYTKHEAIRHYPFTCRLYGYVPCVISRMVWVYTNSSFRCFFFGLSWYRNSLYYYTGNGYLNFTIEFVIDLVINSWSCNYFSRFSYLCLCLENPDGSVHDGSELQNRKTACWMVKNIWTFAQRIMQPSYTSWKAYFSQKH